MLWSITNPGRYPSESFYQAWRNITLFSEHTWGASASGPQPDSEFTRALWKQKQAFALRADSITKQITHAFQTSINANGQGEYIQVFNTNLWPRTDVVTFSTQQELIGKSW